MAKKFDTNPLDPEFPAKAKETSRELETAVLPNQNGKTRKFAEPADTEEQTRKFDESEFESYQNSFGSGEEHQPTTYQAQSFYSDKSEENRSLTLGGITLPENIWLALPYIPFAYIGLIAGVLELFFTDKSEPRVRYHAAQGAAAQIGVLIVLAVLGFASIGTDLADTASWIFSLITTIMLVIFAVKAFQGKPIHIETVQDLTDWIEDKISPQK